MKKPKPDPPITKYVGFECLHCEAHRRRERTYQHPEVLRRRFTGWYVCAACGSRTQKRAKRCYGCQRQFLKVRDDQPYETEITNLGGAI